MSIKFEKQHLSSFIREKEYCAIAPQVKMAHEMLHSGTGLGRNRR